MPVILDNLVIKNEHHITGVGSNALIGNVGDYIEVEMDITVRKVASFLADNCELFPGFPIGNDIITLINSSGQFAEFEVGDTVAMSGGSQDGVYTVVEVIDTNTLRLNASFTNEVYTTGGLVWADKPDAFEFSFGLIENNEPINFESKIDGNVMKYKVDGGVNTSTFTAFQKTGLYSSWIYGFAPQIKETTVTTYYWKYKITHTFKLHPIMTKQNLTLSDIPAWFSGTNCLKYAFGIRAKKAPALTTNQLYGEFYSVNGNTGWLNENFNTGTTSYFIENLVFRKLSDLSVVSGILLSNTDITKVDFELKNVTTNPFSNGNTRVYVDMITIPYDDVDYINTNTEGWYNFVNIESNSLANGTFNGSPSINLKNTYVSNQQLNIEMEINLAAAFSLISSYEFKKVLLVVRVANHTLNITNSDAVTLPIYFGDFAVLTGADGLVSVDEWNTFEHPQFIDQNFDFDTDVIVEDELMAKTTLKIDATSSLYTPFLRKFESGVRLYNTVSGQVVNLDSISVDVSSTPIVNGLNYVDVSVNRGHQAMLTEEFKRYRVKRDISKDASNIWYYDIEFPYLVGWENWQQNNLIPSDFFDPLEPYNGLNDDWYKPNVSNPNWQFEMYHTVVIRLNGLDYEYTVTKEIIIHDYDENDVLINPEIKTYTLTGTEVTPYILGYEKTKVIGKYESTITGLTTADFECVLRLEPKDNGGRNVSTRLSSVYQITSNTQWLSSDASNLIKKTKVGDLYYFEAVIDNTLLQNYSYFDITMRVYTMYGVYSFKLTEDGDTKITENSDFKVLE